MPAILAKKLGMTQLFLEDGTVERVTVLEAGPCPVTGVRTFDTDGYEAVQLAFGSVKEKYLTKPELGHLKKADAPPVRTLVEFRDEAGELLVGERGHPVRAVVGVVGGRAHDHEGHAEEHPGEPSADQVADLPQLAVQPPPLGLERRPPDQHAPEHERPVLEHVHRRAVEGGQSGEGRAVAVGGGGQLLGVQLGREIARVRGDWYNQSR